MGEDDARSSERAGHNAWSHDPVSHRAGRLIAAARDHRSAGRESSLTSSLGIDRPGDLTRLIDSRKDTAIQPELVDQLERPAAVNHVEQRCARSIRDVARTIARELKPDVVFGKQHATHARKEPRLVVADPEQLRQGETGQDRIGRGAQYDVFPGGLIDPIHLRLAALIAPDKRWTDHLVRFIQDHEAVHLAGQSDSAHVLTADVGLAEGAANGLPRCIPPVLGPLLGPQRTVHAHVLMWGSTGMADAAGFVHE